MKQSFRAAALLASLISSYGCSGAPRPGTPTTPTTPSPTPPSPGPAPTAPSQAIQAMLNGLENYIASALRQNEDSLPRNAHLAAQLQEKIAVLQRPSLASEIRTNALYHEGRASSSNGRIICQDSLEMSPSLTH